MLLCPRGLLARRSCWKDREIGLETGLLEGRRAAWSWDEDHSRRGGDKGVQRELVMVNEGIREEGWKSYAGVR